jgi:hypothetical protein
MLLDRIEDFEIFHPKCDSSKEVLHAIATFQADISPSCPYVNGESGGWDYDPANRVLLPMAMSFSFQREISRRYRLSPKQSVSRPRPAQEPGNPGPKGGATGYGYYTLWPRNITLKAAA